MDLAGQLVGREVWSQQLLELGQVHRGFGILEHEDSTGHCAPGLVRHADDRALLDLRQAEDRKLDFQGTQALAAALCNCQPERRRLDALIMSILARPRIRKEPCGEER